MAVNYSNALNVKHLRGRHTYRLRNTPVSRTLISILVNFDNTVVWMVSICTVAKISISSSADFLSVPPYKLHLESERLNMK